MPNRNYLKGVKVEREIVNAFRKAGWNATRTAGSHSPVDVIAWRTKDTKIKDFLCHILYELKFERLPGLIYHRRGTKYSDTLYTLQFDVCDPENNAVIMFQCKRVKR